jgi:hypothetical protein
MGDSRSWAADHEDEEKICSYGVTTKYFEQCICAGCKQDAKDYQEISNMADRIRTAAIDTLRKENKSTRQWRYEYLLRLVNSSTE